MNYPWSLFTAVYPVWYGLLLIWGLHGTLQIPIPLQQTNLRPIFDLTKKKSPAVHNFARALTRGDVQLHPSLQKILAKGGGRVGPRGRPLHLGQEASTPGRVGPYPWEGKPLPLGE